MKFLKKVNFYQIYFLIVFVFGIIIPGLIFLIDSLIYGKLYHSIIPLSFIYLYCWMFAWGFLTIFLIFYIIWRGIFKLMQLSKNKNEIEVSQNQNKTKTKIITTIIAIIVFIIIIYILFY
jgi:hypothetical protein